MSKLTRFAAVLMAAVVVLALGTPAVLADGTVIINVAEDDSNYTVTVEHNETAVNNSTVTVEPTDPANSSYSAEDITDENGTVTFELPENETEVAITATFNDHEHTDTFVLSAKTDGDDDAEPTWDGEGPFGQWVSTLLKSLLSGDTDGPLGQTLSDLVTKNNPGADKRSDEANPGSNGNGPPEHAGPPDHAGPSDDAGPSGEDTDDTEDDDADDEGEEEDDEDTSTEE